MSKGAARDLPIVSFRTIAEWSDWLAKEHATSSGVGLKFANKGSGIPSLSPADALRVALCVGWIDGQAALVDEKYWLQRYTLRTRRSKWSLKNREAALKLIESGEMHPR